MKKIFNLCAKRVILRKRRGKMVALETNAGVKMGRIQQPRELAELKGATKHDPQRYIIEPSKSAFELGRPPNILGESAKEVWAELQTYALPGVLTGSERFIFEITSNLIVEYRADPASFSSAKMNNLIGCLARLGMTPSDRQKIGLPNKPKKNEFDDF